MAETLRIFVSATNDLEAERAIIGRTLAELPVKIRAEIRRSVILGTSYETMYEFVSNVDRFYFLMGQDITAPAGQEWYLALQLERDIFPLRKAGQPMTMAGQEFLHRSLARWTSFRDVQHLERLISRDLIRKLLHPQNRYGLTLPEIDLLRIRQRQLSQQQTDPAENPANMDPGGAGGGGVLLDMGKKEPIDGVELA